MRGVMSITCLTCDQILSVKAKKPHCKRCRHKMASLKWLRNNKEKVNEYQEKYRQENREVCNERTARCYWKKSKEYRERNRRHYRELHGIPLDDPFKKRKAGEGSIDSSGYKTITKRGHPNQMDSKGRIREHVYVMSQHLGRPLNKGESVHHLNGDRLDNRIENLELWSKSQPPGQRVEDKLKWCVEFLIMYGYKVDKT